MKWLEWLQIVESSNIREDRMRVAHEVVQIARNCGETQIWKWVEPPMVQVQHQSQHTHSLTVLNVFS